MATCLALAEQWNKDSGPPILLLFFDEEEIGLKGSKAYIKEYGFNHIKFLLNLELVGKGDHLIFWPIGKTPNLIQQNLEEIKNDTHFSLKHKFLFLPDFPLYFSDAHSFLQAGFKDAITMTRIPANDFELAKKY